MATGSTFADLAESLVKSISKEHEQQLRAILHVAFIRFEAACDRTKGIQAAALR
jgi:hypothetical protein